MPRIDHHSALALAGALILGACSQSSTTTITTNAETGASTTTTTGAAPTAASLGIQPGKWETTVAVTESKTKGMPDGLPNPPQPARDTITSCVTPEQANKGPGEMLKNAKVDCTIKSSTFAGGKLESQATCKLPNGSMVMRTTGTYSPTQLDYDTDMSIKIGPISNTQKIHTSSRRVGACDGTKG